jgi:hypothetical protein
LFARDRRVAALRECKGRCGKQGGDVVDGITPPFRGYGNAVPFFERLRCGPGMHTSASDARQKEYPGGSA